MERLAIKNMAMSKSLLVKHLVFLTITSCDLIQRAILGSNKCELRTRLRQYSFISFLYILIFAAGNTAVGLKRADFTKTKFFQKLQTIRNNSIIDVTDPPILKYQS